MPERPSPRPHGANFPPTEGARRRRVPELPVQSSDDFYLRYHGHSVMILITRQLPLVPIRKPSSRVESDTGVVSEWCDVDGATTCAPHLRGRMSSAAGVFDCWRCCSLYVCTYGFIQITQCYLKS